MECKRLLFGVSSTSEQYQHEIANALVGTEGVQSITDDVIIWCIGLRHAQRTAGYSHGKIQRHKINTESGKMPLQHRLILMGILLSEKGIGPTEERVQPVTEAREPEPATEVHTVASLGLWGTAAGLSHSLQLYQSHWGAWQEKTRLSILGRSRKKHVVLAKATTFAYFDKETSTKVIVDVRPVGLGAFLMAQQTMLLDH